MNRLKAVAATGLLAAAMLAAGPAFAQTSPGAGTTTTGNPTAAAPDFTCGKIVEIHEDHLALRSDNGDLDVIKLGPATDYTARSLAAARSGMREGDFARSRKGDDAGDGSARHVLFGEVDFCKDRNGNEEYRGPVTSFNGTALTITDQFNNPITFKTNANTKYYVHGVLQHTVPAINPGQDVRVLGHENKDESETALRVNLV